MKRLTAVISLLGLALLSACGGGSGGSSASSGGGAGSSSSSSSSSGPTVLSTVTATITSASPTVTLPNVATVDFTGQPDIEGSAVTLSQVIDENFNVSAAEQHITMSANFVDPAAIKVATKSLPDGDVTINIMAPAAIAAITTSSMPTAYVYNAIGDVPEDSEVDGEDEWEPLPATINSASDEISVHVPLDYFQPHEGSYTAILKIGVAQVGAAMTPAAARRAQSQH